MMNHPPPFLECQRTKRPAIQVLFSAVLLAGIGYLAGEGYLILLGTMSLIFIFYALMISIDDSIRLRINEEGLSGENVPQKVVRWEELSEYALVQKKSERISKTFSECKTPRAIRQTSNSVALIIRNPIFASLSNIISALIQTLGKMLRANETGFNTISLYPPMLAILLPRHTRGYFLTAFPDDAR